MSWDELAAWLAQDVVITGLRIFGVLLAAFLLTGMLRRAVGRVEAKIALEGEELRAAQRARTLTKVLSSVGIVAIWVIAVLTILGAFRFDLAPLLAGLGVGGLAIGFGAQTLVKDVVAGFFILLEDQYGIGDYVEVNQAASGTVETLTLRVTGLRDIDGALHYFPNGTITHVSNRSKDWSGLVVDVKVPEGEDIAHARRVLEDAGRRVADDARVGPELLGAPEVLGIESLADSAVVVRVTARTKPGCQFEVARRLREEIKTALDEAKIEAETA